jgi:hypothetical protein
MHSMNYMLCQLSRLQTKSTGRKLRDVPLLRYSAIKGKPELQQFSRRIKNAPGKVASQGGEGHESFPGAIGWLAVEPPLARGLGRLPFRPVSTRSASASASVPAAVHFAVRRNMLAKTCFPCRTLMREKSCDFPSPFILERPHESLMRRAGYVDSRNASRPTSLRIPMKF